MKLATFRPKTSRDVEDIEIHGDHIVVNIRAEGAILLEMEDFNALAYAVAVAQEKEQK